jgi:hypothetical protein
MRAHPAPDHPLLDDVLGGPTPQDAASSLTFWRARLERLPVRRVAARREARTMVLAWEERLRRAELDRLGGGPIGRLLAGAAVLRGQRPGALIRRLVAALLPRRVLLGAVWLVIAAAVGFGVLLGVSIAALL